MTTPVPGPVNIVTVDGPAAAGKTTTSLILARMYGLNYLESGRAYRVMAYLALQNRASLDDENALVRLYRSLFGSPETSRRMFDETSRYGDSLRTPAVDHAVSRVSRMSALRAEITDMIRKWVVSKGDCVVEGRDIGTVVFPKAPVKFYLTAAPEIRARRRFVDEPDRTFEDVLADVMRRDDADRGRKASPLIPAADSLIIDTSRCSVRDVVALMAKKCAAVGFSTIPQNVSI